MDVLIVEDEPNYADTLEMFVDELGYKISGIAEEGKQAMGLFKKKNPDLILMDINLKGELTGIDLAQQIQQLQRTPVIFITSFADKETFQLAKTTSPYAYLIKPFDPDILERSMELAISRAHTQTDHLLEDHSDIVLAPSCFFIKERSRLRKVPISDILWAEVEDKYTIVTTKEKKYTLRLPLKEFVSKLNPSDFVQVHRSYIANAIKIDSIDTQEYVIHIGEHEIPLGRAYKEELYSRLQLL